MQPRPPLRAPTLGQIFGAAVAVVAVLALVAALGTHRAEAATITASYSAGYRDVTINGYGTAGMGTFELHDGSERHLALCVEAHLGHSTARDGYSTTANEVRSAELDALLWWLADQTNVDDDTAVAAAALAWYYAGAVRTIGPLVWSDGHRDFAPVGPLAPTSWTALPRFDVGHMIGLVARGTHLDAAEQRVVELHRIATALAGPWEWSVDPTSHTFTLNGPSGPIASQPVRVTIEPTGGKTIDRTVRTDEAGRIALDVPHPRDGATVRAVATGPGIHREWDGVDAIQRMATATTSRVEATFTVEPLPRHVRVVKRSTDPTIGVAGAVFELRDHTGRVVSTARTDDAGRAGFPPIDPVANPAPYEVIETVAPPGLLPDRTPHALIDPGTDPAAPTVVEVPNDAATVDVSIRKRLSIPEVAPDDLGGFGFVATRREDEREFAFETGTSGASPPVALPLGTYDVCERSVPPWAVTLMDGGCVGLVVDAGALDASATIVVAYTNVVPEHAINTHAIDRSDGDQRLSTSGGTVVDRVELTGLVPGATYTLVGQVIALGDDPAPLDLVQRATFVATAPSRLVELEFDIPAREPGIVVVVARLQAGERVVAVHDDLADPDQTITLVAPPTSSTGATSPPPTTATSTTTAPLPSTTTTTTTTTTTSTSATTSPITTTLRASAPPTVPPTLPPTGSDAAAALLRIGDIGFVVGVGLVVAAGFAPRRRGDAES